MEGRGSAAQREVLGPTAAGEEARERRCPGRAPPGGLALPERLRLELAAGGLWWGWEPAGEGAKGRLLEAVSFTSVQLSAVF